MRIKSVIGPAGVLLIANSLLLPRLFAQNATLTGDVTISASAPSANYGSSTTLDIATGNAGLVQFDLSAYSPSVVVNAAYLQVYADQVKSLSRDAELYPRSLHPGLKARPPTIPSPQRRTVPLHLSALRQLIPLCLWTSPAGCRRGSRIRRRTSAPGDHRNRWHRHSARYEREHRNQSSGATDHQHCDRSGSGGSYRSHGKYRPHGRFGSGG